MKVIEENRVYDNGFFEFLKSKEEHEVNDKIVTIDRTMLRRPPGIRALIIKDNKILLSKEYRYELSDWDYRLPGGKVFDNLDDYTKAIKEDTVMDNINETVSREVLEEVGINIKDPQLIKISKDGSSVIWDLYYFEIKNFEISENGAKTEEKEFVNGYQFYTFDEVIKMCIENKIHEDRTVGVLLTYILKNK